MGTFLTNRFHFLNMCELKPFTMEVEGGGSGGVEKAGGKCEMVSRRIETRTRSVKC